MSRRLSRLFTAHRRHRSKHTGKSLKTKVNVSYDSRRTDRPRRDHSLNQTAAGSCLGKSALENPPDDSYTSSRGRHGTPGSPTSFANQSMAQHCISYSQLLEGGLSRAARPSRQSVKVEDRRTGMMQIRPIRALPVVCSSS